MGPKLGTARVALLLILVSLVVAPACTTLGSTPGGVWGTERRSDQIVGEVRAIDTRRDLIQIRQAYGGTRTVRYDRRTQVVDGRRRYSISRLRRGDDVRIRVAYDRRGRAWADRVEVQRSRWSSRDRDDRWDDRGRRDDDDWRVVTRRVRWQGTVRNVDRRRRHFTLTRGGNQVVVYVPNQLRREDARRLDRLRRGDRVHVEVQPAARNRVVLVRFR